MGKTQRMVGLAIFTAIIIVLQLVSTFIKFGPFSITLAMIPIVVGAAVYGAGAVSYTHLDVYKRQIRRCSAARAATDIEFFYGRPFHLWENLI